MDKNTSQFCARGVTTVILLSVLSACGGSAATTPTVKPPPAALAEMSDRNTALLAKYDYADFTKFASIPSEGSAVYTGIVQGDLTNISDKLTDEVIGEMTLSVTFSSTTPSFSGSATNFHDDKGAAMDGSLAFSNGVFDLYGASIATLDLSANGTLTDTNSQQLVFGTQFEGDFLGSAYEAVRGDWLGKVTHDGKTQDINGKFIAEQ